MMADEFMKLVYDTIAHGDEQHRAWLKAKCEELVPKLESEMTPKEWDLDYDRD